jgi:hypothetical protein
MIRYLVTLPLVGLLTFAQAADTKPIVYFDQGAYGGNGFAGWKVKDEKKNAWHWGTHQVDSDNLVIGRPTRADNSMANLPADGKLSSDLYTEAKFGNVTVELEFMVPKGSNSGIYLMGEYEVQILDSYGKPDEKLGQGDLGALYSAAKPPKNAAKKPGEWQKFVIEFQAPKFEGDKKVANAKFIKVTLNDVVLHENVEMKQHTPGGLTGKEAATGPLMFQGDHGPVAFRNIKITPKK